MSVPKGEIVVQNFIEKNEQPRKNLDKLTIRFFLTEFISSPMVNLVSLSVAVASTILFHYSILNLFLTCFSFLSSFSLTVYLKFFLIQKSESSTNLNYKEGK